MAVHDRQHQRGSARGGERQQWGEWAWQSAGLQRCPLLPPRHPTTHPRRNPGRTHWPWMSMTSVMSARSPLSIRRCRESVFPLAAGEDGRGEESHTHTRVRLGSLFPAAAANQRNGLVLSSQAHVAERARYEVAKLQHRSARALAELETRACTSRRRPPSHPLLGRLDPWLLPAHRSSGPEHRPQAQPCKAARKRGTPGTPGLWPRSLTTPGPVCPPSPAAWRGVHFLFLSFTRAEAPWLVSTSTHSVEPLSVARYSAVRPLWSRTSRFTRVSASVFRASQ